MGLKKNNITAIIFVDVVIVVIPLLLLPLLVIVMKVFDCDDRSLVVGLSKHVMMHLISRAVFESSHSRLNFSVSLWVIIK